MAQTLEQFLDTLSDDELDLLDTDPDFFNEVKAKFATPAQPQQEPTFMESLGQKAQAVTAAGRDMLSPLQKMLQPASDFMGKVSQVVPESPDLATQSMKLAGGIQNVFQKGGEAVSESLAGDGMTMEPALGLPGLPLMPAPAQPGDENAIRTSPEVAALIGAGIQVTPLMAEMLLTPGVMSAFKSVFSKQGAKQAGEFLKSVATRAPKSEVEKLQGGRFFGMSPEEAELATSERVRRFKPTAEESTRRTVQEELSPVQKELEQLQLQKADLGVKETTGDTSRLQKLQQRAQRETAPKKQKVKSFRERLQNLPMEEKQRLQDAQQMLDDAGKSIGKAEDAAGIRNVDNEVLSKMLGDSEALDGIAKIYRANPSLEGLSLKDLQVRRKLAENLRAGKGVKVVRETERAIMEQGDEAARLLEEKVPGLKEGRSTYKAASELAETGVKDKIQRQRNSLVNTLRDTNAKLKEQEAFYKNLQKKAAAREKERAVTGQTKRQATNKKAIIKKQNELKELKERHNQLLEQAKTADKEELSKILEENARIKRAALARKDRRAFALKALIGTSVATGALKFFGQ